MSVYKKLRKRILKDKTIAILENRAGEQLADLVRKYGGTPFSAPALAEIPEIDPLLIAQMVKDWQASQPDYFIFQTGVGVKALFSTTDNLGISEQFLQILNAAVVAVRGTKPSAVLKSRNVRIDLPASEPYTTAEVLASLAPFDLTGKLVVVQRYGDTNWDLQKALQAKGARVAEITTYRWSLPENIKPMLDMMDALAKNSIDMVCFTSASQVHNLFAVAQQLGRNEVLQADLNRSMIASIGPVCTVALHKFGLKVDVEASPPKLGPFISAINSKFV